MSTSSTSLRDRWIPTPGGLARLLAGLWLFGAGEGTITHAALGNSPWTVLAQGVSIHSPLSIGTATIAVSFLVLMLWLPLRQAPGLGTIANALIVGIALDVTLGALPDTGALGVRALQVLAGIALIGLGSGLYINARMGPGPRDGLMTGLHTRFGWPIAGARAGVELTALACGFALGGDVGPGTVAFALGVGPAVAIGLRLVPETPVRSRR